MALDARTGDVWEFENKETGKKYIHRLGIEDFPGNFLTDGGLGDHVAPMANDHRGTWRLLSRGAEPYLSDSYLYGVPKAADRSGCKPWCGLPLLNSAVPGGGEKCGVFVEKDADGHYLPGPSPSWCSAVCRDERRGPLTSTVPVVQAEAPKPVAVQPKCIVCGTGADNWRHVPSVVYGGRAAHEFVSTITVKGSEKLRRAIGTRAPVTEVRSIPACEMGPSAVASAPARQRDTFADLCSEWDLLPDVR